MFFIHSNNFTSEIHTASLQTHVFLQLCRKKSFCLFLVLYICGCIFTKKTFHIALICSSAGRYKSAAAYSILTRHQSVWRVCSNCHL